MNAAFFVMLCFIWGSTWMAIKVNLTAFPPFYSAGLRFLLAGLVMLAVTWFKKPTLPKGIGDYKPALVFGVLNGVSYGLVYWGEQFIPSGLTAVLNASLTFFSVIFAYLYIGERVTRQKVIGSVIGFTGILIIFWDTLSGGTKLAGEAAIIAAAAIYAIAGAYFKKGSRMDPLPAVTIQMFTSGAVLLAVALPAEPSPHAIFNLAGITAFLYLSLVGSALAFYLYNWLIVRMEISKLGYIAMITPAVASVLGTLVLGESIQLQTLAGFGVIMAGIVVINVKTAQPVIPKEAETHVE